MKELRIGKCICFSIFSFVLALSTLSANGQEKSTDSGLPIHEDYEIRNELSPLSNYSFESFNLASEVVGVLDGVKAEPKFAIKTNLIPYVLGVFNVGFELPISNKFSIDMPIYYSPYTLDMQYRFRTLAFQPELRFWFGDVMDKHFIGVHAILGWYEMAFDDVVYQDKDGEVPAYGFGLSYGYFINLSQHIALELTGGLGYIHTDYDKYYNIEGGARYDTGEREYMGYTKIGVSIVYKFNKR